MQPTSISALTSIFNQLQRQGVRYSLGAKADSVATNPRSTGSLSTPISTIDTLDCSGFTRYALFHASGIVIPDGSQNQLAYFQNYVTSNNDVSAPAGYTSVDAPVGQSALYIAFIKPFMNGCGNIGHVWFVVKPGDTLEAETLECDGGGGMDSRPWNTVVLLQEAYAAFRLPSF